MNKTVRDVLDDHLSLCVLAYARLSVRHMERDEIEDREDDMMNSAIQAACLFTVASMIALGGSENAARALYIAREMFRDLEDFDFNRSACATFLGLIENILLSTGETVKDGVVSKNGISAPDIAGARAMSCRQRRRKTPPFP